MSQAEDANARPLAGHETGTGASALESVLIVFQNPVSGRQAAYDDWYTNIHIRDALRLEGAIATQRFVASEQQIGAAGRPLHWAHTIYEWESAAKSAAGHLERACTPRMEISRDASFEDLRDYFYRPLFLSHGWTREAGFRRGEHVLTAMVVAPKQEAGFADWFARRHAPAVLALPGFATAALFALHEVQSLAAPSPFAFAAVYSLTAPQTALDAWRDASALGGDADLLAAVTDAELTCWRPRTPRLRAEEVGDPPARAAEAERRARAELADRFMSSAEFAALLALAEGDCA